jgi:integrase
MTYTPYIFEQADVLASPFEEFRNAFDGWLANAQSTNKVRQTSSIQFYRDIWNPFAAWCIAQDPPVRLQSLQQRDLTAFLEGRGRLSPRHQWRLLNLIDRVLRRHADAQGLERNRAAEEYLKDTDLVRLANVSDRPEVDCLDGSQAGKLVVYLSSIRPGASRAGQLSGWPELRNLAAVGLHLGAGVTPGELRELRLGSEVVAGGRFKGVPWKLKVAGNGNRAARETVIAPWAGHLLRYWLEVLASQNLAPAPPAEDEDADQPFMFPGTNGLQWRKMAHYEAVNRVLVAAEVEPANAGVGGGAFRLRHTFALRQLRRGRSPEDVARWMGIVNLEELERYRHVIHHYEEAA